MPKARVTIILWFKGRNEPIEQTIWIDDCLISENAGVRYPPPPGNVLSILREDEFFWADDVDDYRASVTFDPDAIECMRVEINE